MIAGIDVALVCTGVAIVDPRNVRLVKGYAIVTAPIPKKMKIRQCDQMALRATHLAHKLFMAFDDYEVTGCIIEYPSGGAQSAIAARGMGIATGVIATVMHSLDMPVEIVTASEIKQAVTGSKAGSKLKVAEAVKQKMTIDDDAFDGIPGRRREHVYDAAAAVLAARDGVIYRSALSRSAH